MKQTRWILFLVLIACISSSVSTLAAAAQAKGQAPGGPGMLGVWARPDKEGFVATPTQNVTATIAEGILTESFFPSIDRAQTKDTQLMFVVNNSSFLEERKNFRHQVTRYPQTLAFHVSSVNEAANIRIEKDIVVDPARPVIVVSYDVTLGNPNTKIYVLHNPAADNTAGGDAIYSYQGQSFSSLLSYQSDRRGDEPPVYQRRIFQLAVLNVPATEAGVGFEGVNDPWTQLNTRRALSIEYNSAVNGNVAGALGFQPKSQHVQFKVAIAFASETQNTPQTLNALAQASLIVPVRDLITAQHAQWQGYLSRLNPVGQKLENHMLVLKSLEDKNFKGAIVAGPAMPSLPERLEARETDYESARLRKNDQNGGYRRVWMRDAFQMALGLLAGGDSVTPVNIAHFFARVQQQNGNFPQNTWVDGTRSWTGFQLDQTGFPILLVSRLVELNLVSYAEFRPMVIAAANAIMRFGPRTEQERWEENGGLSPNSIAVACQALYEAAWLEKNGNQTQAQNYINTCNSWRDHLAEWTFVKSGPLGQNYFERMEVANPPDPSHSLVIRIANDPVGGNMFPESAIIDGGFLQWIISGLIPGQDDKMTSTLSIYDRVARAQSAAGAGYLRYNHDGYGPGHLGRPWPLLSGERALAAMVRGEDPSYHIRVLLGGQTSGGMMPEQTDVSACPLGWAHAEVLIVARSLADKKSFYIPRHLNNYFAGRAH